MKFLLALLLALPGLANAAGYQSAPQGGSGFTSGQDVTGDDGIFKTLTSTGTAPSLTATGAFFKSSVTVDGSSTFLDSVTVVGAGLINGALTVGPANNAVISAAGAFSLDGAITCSKAANTTPISGGCIITGGNTMAIRATPGGDNVGGLAIDGYAGSAGKQVAWFGPCADGSNTVCSSFGQGASVSTFTGAGLFEPISKTTLQISLLVPTRVGQYVDNSSIGALCRSTGTSAGNFALATAAGTGCF